MEKFEDMLQTIGDASQSYFKVTLWIICTQ